jgi:serine/threonine protein phosphatase 1
MARYAIGDIHGCAVTLDRLMEKIGPSTEDTVFLLGDLIDRGPDSKAVFDFVFQWQEEGLEIKCLRGNHEQMMLDGIKDPEFDLPNWLFWGGNETIKSFDTNHPANIPKLYLNYIKSLDHYFELQDFILVHASLNLEIEDFREDKFTMLYGRSHGYKHEKLGDKHILHGHTPKPLKEILEQGESFWPRVINLDAGCVYEGVKEGCGYLVAMNMDEPEFIYCKNAD